MKLTGRCVLLLVALLAAVHPTPGRAQIALNGTPSPLVVAGAVAGAQPESVTDATTTYDVTNSSPTQSARILARLDAPLPAGVTLEITLEAPPGATSLGPVALTVADQPVVVGVPPQGGGTGLRVTYRLTAMVSAGVRGTESRQVILTLEQQ
jgi:hypothetical protein